MYLPILENEENSNVIRVKDTQQAIALIQNAPGLIYQKSAAEITKRCNCFNELLDACKRDAELATQAVLRTPTGPLRNKLTEINLLRLKAITEAEKGPRTE